MDVQISTSQKESNNNKNSSPESEIIRNNNIIKAQKTKYFINKHYQRFISIIYFLIGIYFLYFLLCFLISIYVSIILHL